MNTRIKNILQRILPRSRKNRFYFVLVVMSFFIGFFYDSKNNSDIFYSNLIRVDKSIAELRSNNCNNLNNYEFSKKLNVGDIEFDIEVEKSNPNCLNFIETLQRSEFHSFPLTEESINDEFNKKFNNYILKSNSISGLYFLGITLLALLLINLARRIIRWIMNGDNTEYQ